MSALQVVTPRTPGGAWQTVREWLGQELDDEPEPHCYGYEPAPAHVRRFVADPNEGTEAVLLRNAHLTVDLALFDEETAVGRAMLEKRKQSIEDQLRKVDPTFVH